MKSIVVTGGAGFIGSHLCESLIKKGHVVICIDNLTTGRKENLGPLSSNRNFIYIPEDICSLKILTRLKKNKIDQIYHLASPASVEYITKYPVEAALANSLGTKNMLELARLKKAQFLFASSSEVYGNPEKHPQKEDYVGQVSPIGVRSGYDEGKRFGEALCMAYNREFGVNTKIARIFNTYGPHSSLQDSRVIPTFIRKALRNEDIPVHVDGLQTRSFCYVSDTVLGLTKVMRSSDPTPFNIGNPDEYQIKDVAVKIVNLTGSKSKIKFTKRPQDDPARRKPNISKAQQKLFWSPAIPFNTGLIQTIKYFKELLPKNR